MLNKAIKFSGLNVGKHTNKLRTLIKIVEAKRNIITSCNFHIDKSEFIDELTDEFIAYYDILALLKLRDFIKKIEKKLEKNSNMDEIIKFNGEFIEFCCLGGYLHHLDRKFA